jgi:hypothetical protein
LTVERKEVQKEYERNVLGAVTVSQFGRLQTKNIRN